LNIVIVLCVDVVLLEDRLLWCCAWQGGVHECHKTGSCALWSAFVSQTSQFVYRRNK